MATANIIKTDIGAKFRRNKDIGMAQTKATNIGVVPIFKRVKKHIAKMANAK
jgi:hypothetical protein